MTKLDGFMMIQAIILLSIVSMLSLVLLDIKGNSANIDTLSYTKLQAKLHESTLIDIAHMIESNSTISKKIRLDDGYMGEIDIFNAPSNQNLRIIDISIIGANPLTSTQIRTNRRIFTFK